MANRSIYDSRYVKKNGDISTYGIISNFVKKTLLEKHPWVVHIEEIEIRRAAGEFKKDLLKEFGVKSDVTYDKHLKKWRNKELDADQVDSRSVCVDEKKEAESIK